MKSNNFASNKQCFVLKGFKGRSLSKRPFRALSKRPFRSWSKRPFRSLKKSPFRCLNKDLLDH